MAATRTVPRPTIRAAARGGWRRRPGSPEADGVTGASPGDGPYHRAVAEIIIAIVVALVVGSLVLVIVRQTPDQPVPAARATVGIVAGVIGALLILTNITDLIPDSFEAAVGPIGVVALTAGLLLLTAWKLAS